MSDLYHYFKNDEGLRPLADVTVDRALHRLRRTTGKDYRMGVTKETEHGFFKRRVRYWYQLYIPVVGGVMGKDAWSAFRSSDRMDADEITNTIDGILLGIELGKAHHREDVDALRRENEELSREVRELSSERELDDVSERLPDPHHLAEIGDERIYVTYKHSPEEGQYLGVLNELRTKMLAQGATDNRTAVKATKVFGRTMRFDLSNGTFPLLTTKKLHLKSIVHELIWFLNGLTNNEWLREHNVSIWDAWATAEDGKDRKKQSLPKGSLGPLYGEQWRRFPAGEFFYNLTDDELVTYVEHMAESDRVALSDYASEHTPINIHAIENFDYTLARQWLTKHGIDQISQAIFLLKHRPNSRRNIVTAWNPQVVPSDDLSPQENVVRRRAALAACHAMFQIVTEPLTFDERAAFVRQHSGENGFADAKLVVTEENIKGYMQVNGKPAPTHRLCLSIYQRSCDLVLGVPFNVASYALLAHMLAAEANMVPGELLWIGGDVHLYANQMGAAELQLTREPRPFPKIKLKPVASIFDYTMKDIELIDYDPHPAIKAEVAV